MITERKLLPVFDQFAHLAPKLKEQYAQIALRRRNFRDEAEKKKRLAAAAAEALRQNSNGNPASSSSEKRGNPKPALVPRVHSTTGRIMKPHHHHPHKAKTVDSNNMVKVNPGSASSSSVNIKMVGAKAKVDSGLARTVVPFANHRNPGQGQNAAASAKHAVKKPGHGLSKMKPKSGALSGQGKPKPKEVLKPIFDVTKLKRTTLETFDLDSD
jgi:hypothetical protein